MATRHLVLAAAPVDLVAELALADGAAYLLQVVGPRPARLFEGAAAPEEADRGGSHEIAPGEAWTIAASATPMWAWSGSADPTAVAVTEASQPARAAPTNLCDRTREVR